jgi:hypothetical protein
MHVLLTGHSDRVGYICQKTLYTVAYQSIGTYAVRTIGVFTTPSTKIDSHQKSNRKTNMDLAVLY